MDSELWRLLLATGVMWSCVATLMAILLRAVATNWIQAICRVLVAVLAGLFIVLLIGAGMIAWVQSGAAYAAAASLCLMLVVLLALGVLSGVGQMTLRRASVWAVGMPLFAMMALMTTGKLIGGFNTYIVPTGAMSPAIMGHHVTGSCIACGYINTSVPGGSVTLPRCYHCGGDVRPESPGMVMVKGDRLMAASWRRPQRWDAITFIPPERPGETYVKRLAGMPGETVQMIDGDLFVNHIREQKPWDRHLSMWMLVNDTALMKAAPAPADRGWGAAEPWKWDGGRWHCRADETPQALAFQGRFTATGPFQALSSDSDEGVHDLRLQCRVGELAGSGTLTLEWRCRDVTVIAQISAGGITSLAVAGGQGLIRDADLRPGSTLTLAMRDGAAAVLIDDQLVHEMSVLPAEAAAAERWASGGDGSAELSIVARRCVVRLDRILIERDVHYTTAGAHMIGVGEPLQLSDREFFTLGDNSAASADSRFYGPVPVQNYRQVVVGRYWPFNRRGRL